MENLVLANKSITSIKKGLIESLVIASGAKSTATYYHTKEEQMLAIRNQVENLYKLSKELPLIVATQKGVTGRFVSEVLLNEFKNSTKGGACNIVNPIDWYDNGLSDKAVLSALYNLYENGITYVLRLFVDMKNGKVNNERARKIMLGFLWGDPNIEWNSLKYRNKISEILRHIYGVKRTSVLISIVRKYVQSGLFINEKESAIANNFILKYIPNVEIIKAFKIFLFIFKVDDGIKYLKRDFDLLYEYQKAKTDVTSISKVPEEILIGLISDVNHPQHSDLWSSDVIKETTKATFRQKVTVTSTNQQVRQTKSTKKLGVQKEVNYKKASDFLALYKTGYENSFTDEIKEAINDLAKKKRFTNFMYQNIGIVLDNSNSMRGHKQESKNTPKAIAQFTAKVLGYSATGIKEIVTTEGISTDIASAFVELLKKENSEKPYGAIFMITDGYENAYDGLTNEVLSVYFSATNRSIPVFQISPVTGAEVGAGVRKLGDNVVTMAVNDPVAIQPQINARLLEIDTKVWLENQVSMLNEAPVTRRKKININV